MISTLEPRIAIFGATGYVGQELVRHACQLGFFTYAHVRSSEKAERSCESLANLGAKALPTPWTQDAIQRLLEEQCPTLVFSLLGTTKSSAKAEGIGGDIYDAVDYGLTNILIRACLTLQKRPRFVYLSSIGAALNSRSAYLRARGKIEDTLAKSGLSYVSAQPSIISGPDRETGRPMERFAAGVADATLGLGSLLGARQLKQKYQSTNAQTLAQALLRLGLSTHQGIALGRELRGQNP